MSIELTERAADHIRDSLVRHQKGMGLRLGVRTSGCSGFMYTVDYAEAPGDNDLVVEQHGVAVVIDRKSLPFLEGMEVDFVREGLNERFSFRNPNVSAACGCGESFAVE
ncbi:iron-sulfur cluster assembly protein IscA [Gammaproteobacteria bacterium 2W06]|jgi:iron-sulfur cluster assembly protein|uniref:Iron-sulfur cluster assembly accessory protein n=1 Tax=Spiribacter roseus TaxID=1855875 RepID=A0ABV3RYZ0_9GAMM|nr:MULTISPECIES: iron-sulfur cluster assembly accessory protein [Spiribacter]AUB78033.1 iron-sulfur cluster assembly protein IscA [Spiribacter roseus]KAF0281347.1 iron-sulfur cluster assembly protein IscA [Spiribacter roseus]KAF0286137.1 iron-sulfur cluster assembly protein IscA [Spiribacter sp. SSL99]PYZ99851.1 iron-sulfur cluster assembly protein IscA [Gammaproteobacteria bacterium 2W06]